MSPLKVTIIPVTPFQQNCSLLVCTKTNKAAFIDPGGDMEHLISAAMESGGEIEKVFLTHAHLDHAGAARAVADHFSVPIEGPHQDDAFWLDGIPEQCQRFGFPACEAYRPDKWLQNGDSVCFGEQQIDVVHCPGHTPGHVVFHHREAHIAFVGDVIFNGSIGRTDLPKGDFNTLISSIRERLLPLGDDITFVPGHGPNSTFGHERRINPFVGDHIAN